MSEASHTEHMFGPGEMADHYKIIRLIGRGGMGEVYLARDMQLGRKVALKIVHSGALGDDMSIIRFFREARMTARFNHPHIVTVYGVGEISSRPYVALEYLEGQTLRERMDEGRLGTRETLRVCLAIAEGLREAHDHNVLHRDLKPANVMLPRDGRLRVVDFGLARESREARDETAGEKIQTMESSGISGTPFYMSPEQWEGNENSGATDVWALGVILFELVTGHRPFEGDTIHMLVLQVCSEDPPRVAPDDYDVPADLARLIDRCLKKVPSERPDVSQICEILDGLLYPGSTRGKGESSPFRGLLPFNESHADLFFGRDDEIGAFLERLREEPVMPVVGPSGAGKSSFIQAGVIPRLREQGNWRVLGLRPGRNPFAALRSKLARTQSSAGSGSLRKSISSRAEPWQSELDTVDMDPDELSRLAEQGDDDTEQLANGEISRETSCDNNQIGIENFTAELMESPEKLALLLASIAEREGCRVLLFVDQLEELYTLTEDDDIRRGFMEAVCRAADDPDGPVRVVLTLRDDFMVRLAQTEGARDTLGHIFVLRSPGADSLRQILTRPPERAGYKYENDALVDEMIEAVGAEIACLPLLQFACAKLWESRDRESRVLTGKAYRSMGGVEGALAQHADGVLEELTPDQLQLARTILLRLVTPDGTRAVMPHEDLTEGLPDDAREVLARLVKGRTVVVRKGDIDGRAQVELTHESLVTNWERLWLWIKESKEDLVFVAEIRQAASLWENRGRPVEEVWTGAALHEAMHKADRLTALPAQSRIFLEAGARRERKIARRKRVVIAVGMLVLLGVAIASMVIAYILSDKERLAQEQREWAVKQQAEALREGARAALARESLLETRAKVRSSLEIQDSALSRALWWKLSRNPLVWRKDFGGYMYEVAFSPDGRTIAAAGSSGSIYLIDINTQGLRVLRGVGEQIVTIEYSSDGKVIAAGTLAGHIIIWNLEKGPLHDIDTGGGVIRGLTFSPDGASLASASEEKKVRLWDVETGKQKMLLEGHEDKAWGVAFSPDGKMLATSSQDAEILLWDLASGKNVRSFEGHTDRVSDLAFSPDGEHLASGSSDGTVRVWNPSTGAEHRLLKGHTEGIYSVAFAPDGKRLASGSEDHTVRIWNIANGKTEVILDGHTAAVRGVDFGPAGDLVASAGLDGQVRFWRSAPAPNIATDRAHETGVLCLAVTPDGKTLATGGSDDTIRLWDLGSGRMRSTMTGHTNDVMGLSFSPDGKTIASACNDGTVRLWDVKTANQIKIFRGHSNEVWDVAFSPDGTQLASASRDMTLRLWDISNGDNKIIWQHDAGVNNVAFDSDGATLAACGADSIIRTWDMETGESRIFKGHDDAPSGVVFAPDGKTMASAGWDGTVRVWDLATGSGRILGKRDAWAWGIDFCPDGRMVGAAFSDGTAQIWDLSTGDVRNLTGHTSDVNDFRFSIDGKMAITAGDDGTVRTWDSSTGKPVWRAPLMTPSPVSIFTHEGWIDMGDGGGESSGEAWRRAVEERAVRASVSGHNGTLCLMDDDGNLEAWSLADDERIFLRKLKSADDLLAVTDGCVILTLGRAVLHGKADKTAELGLNVTAMTWDRDQILLADEDRVIVMNAGGETLTRYDVEEGAVALVRVQDWLVLGYEEGNLELTALVEGTQSPNFAFEDVPSTPVASLTPGPMGTVLAGFADGTLGLWKLDNGYLLESVRLHGPVVHLLMKESSLYAATSLGDHLVLDLGVFRDNYCDLLSRVWLDVPVVWENGLPVRREQPPDHPCLTKKN